MTIVEYILYKFGTDIEVTLKLDQVIFKSGDACEQISPVVYLAEEESKYRVLAVGNVPESSEKFIQINLFNGERFKSENFDKSVVLERFFEYGINKMMGRLVLFGQGSCWFLEKEYQVFSVDMRKWY